MWFLTIIAMWREAKICRLPKIILKEVEALKFFAGVHKKMISWRTFSKQINILLRKFWNYFTAVFVFLDKMKLLNVLLHNNSIRLWFWHWWGQGFKLTESSRTSNLAFGLNHWSKDEIYRPNKLHYTRWQELLLWNHTWWI